MKKKLLALLMVVSLIIGCCNFGEVHAAEVANGSCEKNATWTLDENGLLAIQGKGKIETQDGKGGDWFSYRENVKEVLIFKGITEIGDNVFLDCSNMQNMQE